MMLAVEFFGVPVEFFGVELAALQRFEEFENVTLKGLQLCDVGTQNFQAKFPKNSLEPPQKYEI